MSTIPRAAGAWTMMGGEMNADPSLVVLVCVNRHSKRHADCRWMYIFFLVLFSFIAHFLLIFVLLIFALLNVISLPFPSLLVSFVRSMTSFLVPPCYFFYIISSQLARFIREFAPR